MKTQRRRGFTVVELVVVIAIIAVLAAVLIPTFTSIIKKANDSAYLQERTNQKIEDLAEKVDNANWLSWEDFEVKLAEKLSKINNDTEIRAAVKEALDEYLKDNIGGQTGLTEEQVQKIIDKAMEGQLTKAQVEEIVKSAITTSGSTADITTITNIVNAAVSRASQNGVTAAQMKAAINEALKSVNNGMTAEKVAEIVNDAIEDAVANINATALTAEDVEDIIKNYYKQNLANAVAITDADVATGVFEVSEKAKPHYLVTTATKDVFTVTGGNANTVIYIDAPNITTINVGDAKAVYVIRTAMTSVHITGTVGTVEVNNGHAVLEAGASVTTVTAAPATNASVKITIAENAEVKALNAEYQDHGTGTSDTIEIVNEGTVGTASLTASNDLKESGTTTTNVKVSNVGESTGTTPTAVVVTTDIPELAEVVVETKNNEGNVTATTTTVVSNGTLYTPVVHEVNSESTLKAAIMAASNGDTIKLTDSFEVTQPDPVGQTRLVWVNKSLTIDGSGYTVTISKNGFGVKATEVTFKNITIINHDNGGRCIDTRGLIEHLTLDNCTLIADGSSGYLQPLTMGGDHSELKNNEGFVKKTKVDINNCTIRTDDAGTKGYAIIIFNPVVINIEGSTIKGWACLYMKPATSSVGTQDSVINVTNSTLVSKNINNGSSNAFGVIKFEDNSTSSPANITFTSSVINVTAASDQYQAVVCFEQKIKGKVTFKSGNTFNFTETSTGDARLTNGNPVDQQIIIVENGNVFISVSGDDLSERISKYLADNQQLVPNDAENPTSWTVTAK